MLLRVWYVMSKLGRKHAVKCLTLIVSLLGHKCVSSHRKPRYINLGFSRLCIWNHVVQSLQWDRSHVHLPGPCIQVNRLSLYFLYCQSCSSKSSSPSVDCISLSHSSPHQPFFLRSKKVPQTI